MLLNFNKIFFHMPLYTCRDKIPGRIFPHFNLSQGLSESKKDNAKRSFLRRNLIWGKHTEKREGIHYFRRIQ